MRNRPRQKPAPSKVARKTLKALREFGEMFQQILELSHDGIFVVQDGRVRECNGFLDVQGGYLREEVLGTFFASFFHRKSMTAVESLCNRSPAKPIFASLPNMLLISKNGRSLKVGLKAQACLFSGESAILVLLSRSPENLAQRRWDAIPDAHLLLEEHPLSLS
jgi:hypothetical protein